MGVVVQSGQIASIRGLGNRGHRHAGRLIGLLLSIALVLGLGLLPVSAAVKSTSAVKSTTPHRGGTLTAVGTASWPSLDPASPKATLAGSSILLAAIYGGLFNVGPNATILPNQALKYTISRNHLIVSVYLRPGLKFQDGTPFDAQAVAWNWNRDRNPATGCTCVQFMGDVTNVTAPSKYKVVAYLSQPYAPLITLMASDVMAYIVSPAAFQAEGATQFGLHPVGAGPFQVVSNSPTVTISLKRFGGYWDKPKPYLDAITYNYISSTQTAYADIQSGSAQFMQAPDPATLGESHSNPNVKIVVTAAPTTMEIRLNSLHSPFDNPVARQIIFLATDMTPILSTVYSGLAKAEQTIIAPGEDYYFGPTLPKGVFTSYNPTEAASLVKQIGGLNVQLEPISDTPVNVAPVQALAKEWQAVGINVTVSSTSETGVLVAVTSGTWQAFADTYGTYVDPGLALARYFQSNATFNHGLNSPTLDSLLAKAAGTSVPAQRQALYKQIVRFLISNHFDYPLFYQPTYAIATKTLQGIPNTAIIYLQDMYFRQ